MCCARDVVTSIICYCFIVNVCGSNKYLNHSHIRVPRELKTTGCQLPQHPTFGKWNIFEETSTYNPEQAVEHRTILQVSCNENYKLDGEEIILCTNGKWSAPIGECLRTCPSRYSTAIMTITCRNNERKLENCEDPTDGTKARFQCADFYEDRALERNPVHVCFNGKWNHKLPECTPICGQKSINDDPTLIVGGKNATRGDYPWQVALYNATNKEQLCGGSLLNQKVILTAAHCVTDSEGNLLSKDNYLVAAGKYFREFNHALDKDLAQFSQIHEMHVPEQYRGYVQNYFGDMAILVTETTFILSTRVQPVCVDWALSRFPITLNPKRVKHGYVSGWGYTVEHNNPSEVLKELEVPFIEDTECRKKIPEDYQRYLTDDKLCAGFTDAGTSVCKGDSGGGLVAKHGGRYYVIGVVSLGPQAKTAQGGCDSQAYSLYTKVQYHVDFILDIETLFRPYIGALDCNDDPNCRDISSITPLSPITKTPMDTCVLPPHPKSGRWSIVSNNQDFQPGRPVLSRTVLKVECEKFHELDGQNAVICEEGRWSSKIGKCLKVCTPRISSPSMTVTCIYKHKETVNCTRAVDGTLARFQCAPFYEDLSLKRNPIHICRDGSWDRPAPTCTPVCGQKSVDATTLIINGTTVNKGDYPWQVAIYAKASKSLICGGSLLSQKVVLTAAHCVTGPKGKPLSMENYIVSVGKYYRKYDDPRDHNEAQFSELQHIFIPEEYRGIIQNYLGDIALLITIKTFSLSRSVQPVCLDKGKNYHNPANEYGYLTGWGFTVENSTLSDVLKELKVPVVSLSTCWSNIREDFEVYVPHDKICAGYLNKGTSGCKGDSGSGLVFRHDGRYWITGVFSLSPISSTIPNACDSQQYGLYTNVSKYINSFILPKLAEFTT